MARSVLASRLAPLGTPRRAPATVAGRHRVRLQLIVNTVNHQLALGTGGIGTPAGKIQTLRVGRHELLERLRRRPSKYASASTCLETS